MIELLVLMVLVGILATIGASRFFERADFTAPASAEQLRTMLRFAQKSAIARNTSVYVRFEENRISLCHAEPQGTCGGAALVRNPGGFTGDDEASRAHCGNADWYCIGRPAGIVWSTTPAPDWIEFDALGRPLLPGRKPGGLALSVASRRDTVTLSVTEETGYVQ